MRRRDEARLRTWPPGATVPGCIPVDVVREAHQADGSTVTPDPRSARHRRIRNDVVLKVRLPRLDHRTVA